MEVVPTDDMETRIFDYYEFRFSLVKQCIQEELEFMAHNPLFRVDPYREYFEYTKTRLGLNRKDPKDIHVYDEKGNLSIMQKLDEKYMHEQDDNTYRQPWKKLRPFHRDVKLTEYVNNLTYTNKISTRAANKNRQYIKKKIIWGLANKRFCKNKSVLDYDQEKMAIKSVSAVVLNRKSGLYEIDWD